ncbi:MFS transporter [Vallitalea maricola]|uniref:MFS transporter n=1 Tax=Vallitalea maricola TaxID=3074433 RepID=A0ACB5ULU3_9FIRM|nr:MFS transporter [Vallitalea sp. AN17-2]
MYTIEETKKIYISKNNNYFKKNFFILIVGKLLSELGSSIFSFALSLYILDLTGSAQIFSVILSFSLLPTCLVNLFLGGFVDNNNQKKIMVLADCINGIVIFIYLTLFTFMPENILLIGIVIVIVNSIRALFSLALNSSIPELVGQANVMKSNSFIQGITPAVHMVGPVIGAILYENIGIEIIILLNASLFICSSILEGFFKFEYQKKKKEIKKLKKNFYLIVRYLKNNRTFSNILLFALVVNGIFLPQMLLGVPYVSYNIIDVTPIQLSFIETASALGSVIGVFFVAWYKNNNILLKYFFKLLKIQAVLIMLFSFSYFFQLNNGNKWMATLVFSILVFVIQGLNMIQNVPLFTYFQLTIPKEIRGRIIGVAFAALYISPPIGMLIYGSLFEWFQSSYVFIGTGVVLIVLCNIASKKINLISN